MFPRWCRLFVFRAGGGDSRCNLEGFASINQAGALLIPITAAPKSCSGAFRYAARDGNSDIVGDQPGADLRRGPPASPARATRRAPWPGSAPTARR